MHPISQSLFEVVAKDQGEKFRTIINLTEKASDSDWFIFMDQIKYLAGQGLAYLTQLEDTDTEGTFDPIEHTL